MIHQSFTTDMRAGTGIKELTALWYELICFKVLSGPVTIINCIWTYVLVIFESCTDMCRFLLNCQSALKSTTSIKFQCLKENLNRNQKWKSVSDLQKSKLDDVNVNLSLSNSQDIQHLHSQFLPQIDDFRDKFSI